MESMYLSARRRVFRFTSAYHTVYLFPLVVTVKAVEEWEDDTLPLAHREANFHNMRKAARSSATQRRLWAKLRI